MLLGGYHPPPLTLPVHEVTRAALYQYPLAAEFDLGIAKRIRHIRHLHVDFVNPAINLIFWIENALLQKAHT